MTAVTPSEEQFMSEAIAVVEDVEVEESLVEEDLLIEDVSIDGMCGVY